MSRDDGPPVAPAGLRVVALDADDTLWHSEGVFVEAQSTLVEILAPWTPEGVDPLHHNDGTERRNLELFGYGIKGFTLSMVETAIEVSDGRVPASAIARIVELGKEMLAHPVDLLDGVGDAVEALAGRHRLALVTKGDLIHQEQKIARSGLADHFDRIEIVAEKDTVTYRRVARRLDVDPDAMLMVGNSVRSDVLPVLDIGGHAVHVPYDITWDHEIVEDHGPHTFPVFSSLADVEAWLRGS